MTTTEMVGFTGVGLAGIAYLPQITHLIKEHCSAGISRLAFGMWLVSSLLVTAHAVATTRKSSWSWARCSSSPPRSSWSSEHATTAPSVPSTSRARPKLTN